MIRIVNSLEKELNFRPKFSEFYSQPTIQALAASYEQVSQASPSVMQQEQATFEILVSPAERQAFKQRQLALRDDDGYGSFPLASVDADEQYVERYTLRSSQRRFRTQPVPFSALSTVLSNLRRMSIQGQPKYLYASAGGLYPVQTYLYIKAGRVEGVAGGYYYYHPVKNHIVLLSPETQFPDNTYFWINQPVFAEAACALFFVAQMQAITPIYGATSREYCLLEAGLMAQLLEMATPREQLGLCQVGGLDFEPLRQLFQLDEQHSFLYSLLAGLAEDEDTQRGAVVADEWEEEYL